MAFHRQQLIWHQSGNAPSLSLSSTACRKRLIRNGCICSLL